MLILLQHIFKVQMVDLVVVVEEVYLVDQDTHLQQLLHKGFLVVLVVLVRLLAAVAVLAVF